MDNEDDSAPVIEDDDDEEEGGEREEAEEEGKAKLSPTLALLTDSGPLGRMLTLGGGEDAVLLTGVCAGGGRTTHMRWLADVDSSPI